jgi:hypothetical protein
MITRTIQEFTPEIVYERTGDPVAYAVMLVQISRCPACNTPMVVGQPLMRQPFPYWNVIDFDAQRKRAGWHLVSSARIGENLICDVCEKDGKALVVCAICKHACPSSEIQESFGVHNQDHLCVGCYATIPAKQWQDAVDKLEREHEFDHE